jgi:glutaredoxin
MRRSPTEVVLVTQDGCKPCLRVKRILGEIAPAVTDLSVREVQFDSEEGARLAAEHGILFPPAVIGDGRLIGKGKIREEDLRLALGVPAPRDS